MLSAYPKIFSVGAPGIASTLLIGDVEVTEKIDGSAIAFSNTSEGLFVRSKGSSIMEKDVLIRTPDKLFSAAFAHILNMRDAGRLIPEGIYYGEVVSSPKHNSLTYGSVPRNNILLYGFKDHNGFTNNWDTLKYVANNIELDAVPLIHFGPISNPSDIKAMLDRTSVLGNTKIEGVVIKNYNQVANSPFSSSCFGKYVSEAFKEINSKNWAEQKNSNSVDAFIESFRTEARWEKSLQHLRDDGKLTGTLKDIGTTIVAVNQDIETECKQMIKDKLYDLYIRTILRKATAGFPEYFKNKLLENSVTSTEVSCLTPTAGTSTESVSTVESPTL